MMDLKIAEIYADAMIALATEQDILEQMEDDLLYVKQVFAEQKELCSFLASPLVERSAKVALLEKIFQGGIMPYAAQFLYVMVERHREDHIVAAIDQFVDKARQRRGILSAKVRAARALSEESKALLKKRLSELTQKDVWLEITEDSSLIGGFVVDIGDKRIDASVARQLQDMEKVLLEGPFNK